MAVYPIIAINNQTGSDTTASGDNTAVNVNGTLAQTLSSTTVNITDAVSLVGVPTDGSACLWVVTASGRRWSRITNITGTSGAWVVTVSEAYGVTAATQSWAIGGKRATIAGSTRLFTDAVSSNVGWTIDLQKGNASYVGTSALAIAAVATFGTPLTITSLAVTGDVASDANVPTVTTSTNSINLWDVSASTALVISNIRFTNTAGTKGTTSANGRAIVPVSSASLGTTIINCIFDGFAVAIDGEDATYFRMENGVVMGRCEVKNSVFDGIRMHDGFMMDHCWVHDNGGDGVNMPSNFAGTYGISVNHCVFSGNTGRGFYNKNTGAMTDYPFTFNDNTFEHNGGPGIEMSGGQYMMTITGCLFYQNTTASIKLAATGEYCLLNYNNAYESGTLVNISAGLGDVTLTAETRNSSTDYGLNSTAGGGAAAKSATAKAPNASANTPGDIGAIPSGGGASSNAGAGPFPVYGGTMTEEVYE